MNLDSSLAMVCNAKECAEVGWLGVGQRLEARGQVAEGENCWRRSGLG
jgi:hypothetical protein